MGLLLMNLSRFADSIDRDNPNQREQNMIFSVLQYIETHYRGGTLSEVSTMLRQSDYAVSRLLKRRVGQNFKELLQARKLQQAAYLLENTELSIDAVIEQIGYDNSSYFYRRFQEPTVVLPWSTGVTNCVHSGKCKSSP
ncbi:MAG: helix-turn-helix transcriptional regulator [Oscillibacter sp.]|nr:helix-turn-helix transcriptional regulator [Oscillibacter sp.]